MGRRLVKWCEFLGRRRVFAVIVVFLFLNAAMLPRGRGSPDEHSVVGRAVGSVLHEWATRVHRSYVDYYAFYSAERGWSVEFEPRANDELIEAVVTDGSSVLRSGFWTPWYVTRTKWLRIIRTSAPGSVVYATPQERQEIYEKLRVLDPQRFTDDRREEDLSGVRTTVSISWPGVLNDLLVLVAFVALGFSSVGLAWRFRQHLEYAKEQGRTKRGLCRSCEYDRRGLAMSLPCPECGDQRPPARMG